ncbi:MAG: hypothetical protein GY806_06430 [Gammaproteobacteria bacterium]|nr:hypothetical protein [Gammaproteobacteria bacterium]
MSKFDYSIPGAARSARDALRFSLASNNTPEKTIMAAPNITDQCGI